ncbi:peroxidase-related enzyme [Nonomuraea thailandensis]
MTGFTTERLGWRPWLAPLTEEELTDAHHEALVDSARAASPYFLLLARDPGILHARTKTDQDIFYNPDGGLPRAERELAATATSRRNGCVFCASVHARFAGHYSKRPGDVRRLLDEGWARGRTTGGGPSSTPPWRWPTPRPGSARSTSRRCARPGSTTWRSATPCTPARSSAGRTG